MRTMMWCDLHIATGRRVKSTWIGHGQLLLCPLSYVCGILSCGRLQHHIAVLHCQHNRALDIPLQTLYSEETRRAA